MKKHFLTLISAFLFFSACSQANKQYSEDKIEYDIESETEAAVADARQTAADAAAAAADAIAAANVTKEYKSLLNDSSGGLTPTISENTFAETEFVVGNYYMFTAVNVEYEELTVPPQAAYATITSGISEYSYKPNKDDEYIAMDILCGSFDVTHLKNYNLVKRKAYVFTSYAEASEKRQKILKTGVK